MFSINAGCVPTDLGPPDDGAGRAVGVQALDVLDNEEVGERLGERDPRLDSRGDLRVKLVSAPGEVDVEEVSFVFGHEEVSFVFGHVFYQCMLCANTWVLLSV
jgi:hypothetical protein